LGHALTTFLLAHTDATILIYSRDEYKQLLMRQHFDPRRMRYFLGDVRDLRRLTLALHDVDLVIHGAALKYVDVGEYNPSEILATNVHGTQNVIDACRLAHVQRAVFISSDKAVHSVNIYGHSKALASCLWIQANSYTPQATEYVCVRYANVTGSRGSVVPTWRAQCAEGVPPSLTDCRMSRFWLTLDEAVALVWFTAQHGVRGSTLVPHLPAYQVMDLLRAVVGEDIVPTIIGARQGEKIAEILMTDEEMDHAVTYQSENFILYYGIPPTAPSWDTQAYTDPIPGYNMEPWMDAERPYCSDTWSSRLSVDDLRQRLALAGV